MANWDINNDLVNGDDLLLYLTSGKTVVAYATSCSINVEQETIDTSSKFSCRWNANMGGRASYTISADALYCDNASGLSFDDLLAMQVEGKMLNGMSDRKRLGAEPVQPILMFLIQPRNTTMVRHLFQVYHSRLATMRLLLALSSLPVQMRFLLDPVHKATYHNESRKSLSGASFFCHTLTVLYLKKEDYDRLFKL